MANKKPKKGPESLTVREFLGPEMMRELKREKYANNRMLQALLCGEPPSGVLYDAALWDTVRSWSPVWLLRKLGAEGNVETYKRCLAFILGELNARPPDGVLQSFRWPHGRPRESSSAYVLWCEEGKPDVTTKICDSFAKHLYPDEFKQAAKDQQLRKRLRDRVRASIRRKSATKID